MIVTDPINSIDTSSLSEPDRVEIEKLRAAYDRAGPKAVAERDVALGQKPSRPFQLADQESKGLSAVGELVQQGGA